MLHVRSQTGAAKAHCQIYLLKAARCHVDTAEELVLVVSTTCPTPVVSVVEADDQASSKATAKCATSAIGSAKVHYHLLHPPVHQLETVADCVSLVVQVREETALRGVKVALRRARDLQDATFQRDRHQLSARQPQLNRTANGVLR